MREIQSKNLSDYSKESLDKESELTRISINKDNHDDSTKEGKLTKSVRVEEISNGYILEESYDGKLKNGEWFYKTIKTYYEKNPLEEENLKLDV